ncbi:uncharacterized protein [Haliotis asinina]|uniref:uncharacterized protein n=1 Tax=Haliotis asinina TaxID=109174 RepID=UPI003531C90D
MDCATEVTNQSRILGYHLGTNGRKTITKVSTSARKLLRISAPFIKEKKLTVRTDLPVPLKKQRGRDSSKANRAFELRKKHKGAKARVKKPYDKDNLVKAYEATVYDVPDSTLRDRTRCYPFLNNKWFNGFLKRWPDLKLAKPQKLHLARAKGACKQAIDKYFRELKAIMTRHSFNSFPERIFNIDETGVSTEHNPSKVVCGKESTPQAVTSPRSASVTIIAGANALGNYVPPFYVFPGKRWSDDLLTGARVGSNGKMSQTGWSNSAIFETYVMDHLAKHAGIKEGIDVPPTPILYDGHKSHISLTLTDWARKRNVLFVLPPHTSHLTQPLDVRVFGPFKNPYYRECQTYLHNNPGVSITRYEDAALSAQPYIKALCPANISNAFRKSGIFPFDRGVIDEAQTAPAIIYPAEVLT